MKKRILVRLIVFFCFTALIWNHLADILITKYRNQNTADNMEAKNADIIFLGTSQGALAINPQIMWDCEGITAYNFSGNGQYIGITYYVLQEILENFTPQVIALDVFSIINPGPFLNEGNLLYNFTVISDPVLRYQMYRENIRQEDIYFSTLLRYHERWKEITNIDFEESSYVLGAELHTNPAQRAEIMELPGIPEADGQSLIGEREWDYLCKIVSLAKSKNCEILFLRMPGGSNSTLEEKTQQLIRYGEENGIEICDMRSDEFYRESGMAVEDFRDLHHLNIFGADKLSMWLGKYLKDNNYVCDRRSDNAAIEWETKVEEARMRARLIRLDMKMDYGEDYYKVLQEYDGCVMMILLCGAIPRDANIQIE